MRRRNSKSNLATSVGHRPPDRRPTYAHTNRLICMICVWYICYRIIIASAAAAQRPRAKSCRSMSHSRARALACAFIRIGFAPMRAQMRVFAVNATADTNTHTHIYIYGYMKMKVYCNACVTLSLSLSRLTPSPPPSQPASGWKCASARLIYRVVLFICAGDMFAYCVSRHRFMFFRSMSWHKTLDAPD